MLNYATMNLFVFLFVSFLQYGQRNNKTARFSAPTSTTTMNQLFSSIVWWVFCVITYQSKARQQHLKLASRCEYTSEHAVL